MYANQDGRCAICSKSITFYKEANVDHNHNTSQVRGILCINCNTTLGLLKEDVKLLEKMKKYIILYKEVV